MLSAPALEAKVKKAIRQTPKYRRLNLGIPPPKVYDDNPMVQALGSSARKERPILLGVRNFLARLKSIRLSALWPSLVVAFTGLGVALGGVLITWRAMERENRAYVQQSIGDTAALLASHVRAEIDDLVMMLGQVALEQLVPLQRKQELELRAMAEDHASPVNEALTIAARAASAANSVSSIVTDPDISDIAIWRRADPQSLPERSFLAINARYKARDRGLLDRLLSQEEKERSRIMPAFQGYPIVLAGKGPDQAGVALVAAPLGNGEGAEIVVAHLSLDKFQKAFSPDKLAQAILIDVEGTTLAHSDHGKLGTREKPTSGPIASLFAAAQASRMGGSQAEFRQEDGTLVFGGFRRVEAGMLTVLATIPESQATLGMAATRRLILFYLGVAFFTLLGLALLGARGRRIEVSNAPALAVPQADPRDQAVIALHGSLRGFNQMLEALGPEEAAQALNEFLEFAAARVRERGAEFERYGGVSFIAYWSGKLETPAEIEAEASRSLECVQALVRDLENLNESRKLDGKKALSFGMGLHMGRALLARIGPRDSIMPSAVGEALARARALDRIGFREGHRLLISHSILKSMPKSIEGKLMGETKLTEDSGLTAYYTVEGDLRGESQTGRFAQSGRITSGETRIHITAPEAVSLRWSVNNGSQIVGPFTALEIAGMLFSQELDFDSECWSEESGKAGKISSSSIFTGSTSNPDPNNPNAVIAEAKHWVFDGKMVHGPLTEGFIRTAYSRGALEPGAWVCSGSTIQGWVPLKDFAEAPISKEPTGLDRVAA